MSVDAYLDPDEIEYVEELLEAQRKAELEDDARYLEEDLYEFVAAAWHIVEPDTKFVHGWHIDAMCEHLEAVAKGEIKRLYITMPPGHAKTMICSVMFPAWLWCKQPGLRLLTACWSKDFAERDAAASLAIIESDWYQDRWPLRIEANTRAKQRFANERRGYRVTTTPLGRATGEGGAIFVIDDPISMGDVDSPAKRKKTLHWWNNVVPTRIRNHQPGAIVMVGQRGHDTDPIGHALKQNLPGSVHLNLPARYDPQYRVDTRWFKDPRTKPGQLLWPEVYDKTRMLALTSQMDAFAVASQLQQTPEVDGGAIIKRVWWRKWTEWTLPACEFYLISIDPSIKDERQHSQWAAQVWGVFPEEERGKERWSAILLYAWAEHLDYPTAKERVLQLYSDWTIEDQPPDEVCIEDKAAGPMILREMDKAGLQNLHGHNPNDGSKIARGNMVADAWRYGRVWVPTKPIKPGQRSETILPSWAKSVVDQCAMVPKSEYDDQFDAATQALARLRDLGYIDLDTDAYATPTSAPDEEPRAVSAYGS